MPLIEKLQSNGVRFESRKFQWIGAYDQISQVLAIWHTSPGGTIDELKTKDVVLGSMGAHWLADPAVKDRLLQRIPLGRVADPQDVAGPVQFFCSAAAAFVTGQILYVDGGLTATQ